MDSSLQHLIEQLQQKKAQAEASLVNLKIESALNLTAYYNDILHKLNCLANSGSSIPVPDSYIREEIAKASVFYQKPLITLISRAFNLPAIFPFVGENGCNPPVNNQEEMSGVVENALENARQLARQPTGCSTGNCETNDSPSNAAQSINLSQFNSHSNLDNQINMNEGEIVNDNEQIDHVDAEDDGNGNLEKDKSIDNIETEVNNHYDRQESDHEGSMIDEAAANDGDSDHFKKQVSNSGVEDNDVAEEEPTAGPSTSNGQLSKPEALSVITKMYKCPVTDCKKAVKNKIALNRHFLSAHKVKKYRCMVRRCYGRVSTSFTTKAQFEDHLEQVHGSSTRFTCHCSKKFNSHTELNVHFRNYHERGRFACSKDGCTFKPASTRIKVLHHQANHPNARYECPVGGCDKSFKLTSHLDKHFFTHSGEHPFDCPECGESFNRKGNLTRHLRIHRNDKCFRCTWPQCTYSSTNSSHVLRHIRGVHFDLPQTKRQQAEEGIEDDRDPREYLAKD